MVKRMNTRKALGLSALVLLPASVAAAGTINSFTLTDNGWTYAEQNIIDVSTSSFAGFADLFFGDGPDHFYQNWWWFRGAGDSREFALSNQTFGVAAGNTALLTYLEPVAGVPDAVEFTLNYQLQGLSPTEAIIRIDWSVTNKTGDELGIDFFAYMDADLGGFAGDDNAALIAFGPSFGQIRVTDGALQMDLITDIVQGIELTGWEIDAFPGVRNKLTDPDLDDLANSGSPFGPGDFAGAFQHTTVLAPFDSAYGTLIKHIVIPTPGSLVILVLGLIPARRRRRG